MIKPAAYMIDEVWAVTEADFEKPSILEQHIKDDRAVPLYAIPPGYALVPMDLVNAAAHVGIDFGYGKFELQEEHLTKFREISEAGGVK